MGLLRFDPASVLNGSALGKKDHLSERPESAPMRRRLGWVEPGRRLVVGMRRVSSENAPRSRSPARLVTGSGASAGATTAADPLHMSMGMSGALQKLQLQLWFPLLPAVVCT